MDINEAADNLNRAAKSAGEALRRFAELAESILRGPSLAERVASGGEREEMPEYLLRMRSRTPCS